MYLRTAYQSAYVNGKVQKRYPPIVHLVALTLGVYLPFVVAKLKQ